MIAFDPSSLSAGYVSALPPGQLFCHRSRGEDYQLAIRVGGPEPAGWLNLTGEHAFLLDCLRDPSSTLRVLALPIMPSELRMRVDFASGAQDVSENIAGRLVFGEGKAHIATWWKGSDPRYFNTVECDRWAEGREGQPRFIFERWALTYRDESGDWIDLVTRTPNLAAS